MRKLTEEEIVAAQGRHLNVLSKIDAKIDEKKDVVATFNDEVKIMRERELELRQMLISGQAKPEQLTILDIE